MRKTLLGVVIYSISFGLTLSISVAKTDTSNSVAVSKTAEQLIAQLTDMEGSYNFLDRDRGLYTSQPLVNDQNVHAPLSSDLNNLEQFLNSDSNNPTIWNEKFLYKEPLDGAGSKEAVDAFYNQEVNKAKKLTQIQAETAKSIYKAIIETKENIDKLFAQLKRTGSNEEAQEIQIQLASSQTLLQIQILQMQAAAMIQKAQKQAAEMRSEEERKARYKDYAKQIRSNKLY